MGNHLIKSRDSHHNSVDENTTLSTNLDINNKLSTSITEQESADGWVSMDADLLKLWNNNITCRELSLIIIRTLFEDIYLLDDQSPQKKHLIESIIDFDCDSSKCIRDLCMKTT